LTKINKNIIKANKEIMIRLFKLWN